MNIGRLRMDIVHLAEGTHLTVFVSAPVKNVEHEARVQDLIYCCHLLHFILLFLGVSFFYFSLCHSPKMHFVRTICETKNASPRPKLGQRLIRRKTRSSKSLEMRNTKGNYSLRGNTGKIYRVCWSTTERYLSINRPHPPSQNKSEKGVKP